MNLMRTPIITSPFLVEFRKNITIHAQVFPVQREIYMILRSTLANYKIDVRFRKKKVFQINESSLGLCLKDNEYVWLKPSFIASYSGNVELKQQKIRDEQGAEKTEIEDRLKLTKCRSRGFSQLYLSPRSEKIVQIVDLKGDGECCVNADDIVCLEKSLSFEINKLELKQPENKTKLFYYYKVTGVGKMIIQTSRDPLLHEVNRGFPLVCRTHLVVLWELVDPEFCDNNGAFDKRVWIKFSLKKHSKRSGIVIQSTSK